MGCGPSWAYEQSEQEYREKVKAKFEALTPYEAESIYESILWLKGESMSRKGHNAIDAILSKLNKS